MKLIKVFDDDDISPKSGWAYLENGHLTLKDNFMGLSAGTRLLVKDSHVIRFRETCELNELLRAEQKQAKIFK
jgi:hypothetical protein